MMKGLKTNGLEIACAECGQVLAKDGKLKANFCPKCGNPLNISASVKYEKEVNKDKLIMLYEILDEQQESNASFKDLINSYIKELNEQ